MNRIIFTTFVLLVVTSCGESKTDGYQLSDELKEKAKAIKEGTYVPGATIKEIGETQETSPEWVALVIFKAAQTGDFSTLSSLCDPQGEADEKAQRLCAVVTQSEKEQQDFVDFFKLGSIVGKPKITGNKASVDIKFGYDGSMDETLFMVSRAGKWYLSGF